MTGANILLFLLMDRLVPLSAFGVQLLPQLLDVTSGWFPARAQIATRRRRRRRPLFAVDALAVVLGLAVGHEGAHHGAHEGARKAALRPRRLRHRLDHGAQCHRHTVNSVLLDGEENQEPSV